MQRIQGTTGGHEKQTPRFVRTCNPTPPQVGNRRHRGHLHPFHRAMEPNLEAAFATRRPGQHSEGRALPLFATSPDVPCSDTSSAGTRNETFDTSTGHNGLLHSGPSHGSTNKCEQDLTSWQHLLQRNTSSTGLLSSSSSSVMSLWKGLGTGDQTSVTVTNTTPKMASSRRTRSFSMSRRERQMAPDDVSTPQNTSAPGDESGSLPAAESSDLPSCGGAGVVGSQDLNAVLASNCIRRTQQQHEVRRPSLTASDFLEDLEDSRSATAFAGWSSITRTRSHV